MDLMYFVGSPERSVTERIRILHTLPTALLEVMPHHMK